MTSFRKVIVRELNDRVVLKQDDDYISIHPDELEELVEKLNAILYHIQSRKTNDVFDITP